MMTEQGRRDLAAQRARLEALRPPERPRKPTMVSGTLTVVRPGPERASRGVTFCCPWCEKRARLVAGRCVVCAGRVSLGQRGRGAGPIQKASYR